MMYISTPSSIAWMAQSRKFFIQMRHVLQLNKKFTLKTVYVTTNWDSQRSSPGFLRYVWEATPWRRPPRRWRKAAKHQKLKHRVKRQLASYQSCPHFRKDRSKKIFIPHLLSSDYLQAFGICGFHLTNLL